MSNENKIESRENQTPAHDIEEQQAIKDKAKETGQKLPPPQELPADNVKEHPQRQLG